MLKILIICDNNKFIKNLINHIIVKIDDLKVNGIANTLDEAQKIMINDKPDFILTNNKLVIPIVKKIYILHLPQIILISKSSQKPDKYKNVFWLDENLNFSEMYITIHKFFKENILNSKRKTVIQLLIDLGFDFKIAGTSFLLDAILYTHTYEGSRSFEKLVDTYSYVAKLNNTTTQRVTWSINRTVDYMYQKHTKNTYGNVEKYFKIKYPEKITPKLLINIISNNLDP